MQAIFSFQIQSNILGIPLMVRDPPLAIQIALPQEPTRAMLFLVIMILLWQVYPRLAILLHHLNQLLKSNSVWEWSSECQQAFQQVKNQLISAKVLAHYDPSLPLIAITTSC